MAKELQAIVAACAAAVDRGQPAALATVVRTGGSTYRRPGARMLVLGGEGAAVGSISGGCLEDDARERALEVIASGRPALVRYDTTADGDIIFGSGLGCQGTVEVFIQPLPQDLMSCFARTLDERQPGALALVFAGPPDVLGKFLYLWEDEQSAGDVPHPALALQMAKDARKCLRNGKSGVRTYAISGDREAQVYIDHIRPAKSLLICGAGHDAVPLAQLGKQMGWRVRIADPRPAYANPARFPDANEVTSCPDTEFAERMPIEPGEAAVVMTHHFLHDAAILRALLASPAGYIGVLGPTKRTARLLKEIGSQPDLPPGILASKSLARMRGPAGLDIGAEAPEQIALAIVAEIEAALAGRPGGPLKRRRGPLH
jgi:xanthine/CO dehydrogenase XdhC/CoxF family maturation factor